MFPITPNYNTKTFADMFNSAADFSAQCLASDLTMPIVDADLKNIFYMLYQKYGNSPIINLDETQWKYKVFYIIFTYGAEWKRKIEIQATLRTLSEDDILKRGEDIFNHAFNPSVAPSTTSTEELGFVDNQSVSKKKMAKISGYQFLWEALDSSVNDWLVKKFEPCFSKFVNRNISAVYCTPNEEDED